MANGIEFKFLKSVDDSEARNRKRIPQARSERKQILEYNLRLPLASSTLKL